MIPELEKWKKENGARYVKESTDIRPRETSNKEDDQKGKQSNRHLQATENGVGRSSTGSLHASDWRSGGKNEPRTSP